MPGYNVILLMLWTLTWSWICLQVPLTVRRHCVLIFSPNKRLYLSLRHTPELPETPTLIQWEAELLYSTSFPACLPEMIGFPVSYPGRPLRFRTFWFVLPAQTYNTLLYLRYNWSLWTDIFFSVLNTLTSTIPWDPLWYILYSVDSTKLWQVLVDSLYVGCGITASKQVVEQIYCWIGRHTSSVHSYKKQIISIIRIIQLIKLVNG